MLSTLLRRRHLPLLLIPLGCVTLTSCTPAVPLQPAPHATESACAAVVVRLPDTVGGLSRRDTNAQGTGAWGNPAAVLLRCGVEAPGPTTDRCVEVNGVDWVIDESDAPHFTFTTFGRSPAIQVIIDNGLVAGDATLSDLSRAVAAIPATGGCTAARS